MWLTWPARLKIHLLVTDQVVHRTGLAHVGDVHAHEIFNAGDIEQVAAVFRNQGVDDQHAGTECDELMRERAADESKPAGNHDATVAVERAVIDAARHWSHTHRFIDSGGAAALNRRVAEEDRSAEPSPAEDHEFHPQLQHVDTGPEDAAEVEELRAAVRAVIVVHGDLDDPEAGILDLAHQLEADDARVALQLDAIEDLAAHQPEVAVDVADA